VLDPILLTAAAQAGADVELRSRPALAGLLADAVIAGHLRGTAALPTFFPIRTPRPRSTQTNRTRT